MNSGDGLKTEVAFPSGQESQQDSPPSLSSMVAPIDFSFTATCSGGVVGTVCSQPMDADNTPPSAQEKYDLIYVELI